MKKLRGRPVLNTEAQRVAAALTKLAQNDTAGARELLTSAKNFPIAGHLLKIVREREIGAVEAAAERAWQEIATLVGEKLTKASAKKLTALLDAFENNHGETDFCRGKTAVIAELRERVTETIVGFSINKLFKGKVEAFDPKTNEVVLFYDFEDPSQIEDWASSNSAIRNGVFSVVKTGGHRADLVAPIGGEVSISFDGPTGFGGAHDGVWARGAQITTKPRDGKQGLQLWFNYKSHWKPCEFKPGGLQSYAMVITGNTISGYLNGKLVSKWNPPRFDAKSDRNKTVQLCFGSWWKVETKAGFDNVRIKGILDGEWLKKKLAAK
jgi:hypothetical protein